MALRYTTVKEFWEFIGLNESILDFQPGNKPERETISTSTVAAGKYYLNQLGVNEDTLTLYAGSTQLTVTTHYTFDSDTSEITITSDGATALSGENLTAEYEFNALGKVLSYSKTEALLSRMEARLDSDINGRFADQSSATPEYLALVNELHKGKGLRYRSYQTDYYPLIKLQTTTDGAFTLGDTTLTLTDASGFPSSGTIYVGGNKVTYSARSSNDLTVPNDTPTISNGAVVRGEVVEISTAASGTSPSFLVLTPDTQYAVDYDSGEIQLQDDYYYDSNNVATTDGINTPQFGTENRFRITYLHAWHKPGQDATIPDEIKEVLYMMAGRQLVQRTVLKSLAGQRDNFNPNSFAFSKNDINEIIRKYIMIQSRNV
jgi:hypothetical protein